MSAPDLNGWTVETLRKYIERLIEEHDRRYEQRFAAQEQAVASALSSADRAVAKAEDASNRRFESVNEFRQTLTDQAQTFMPRGEYETEHRALRAMIEVLAKKSESDTGRDLGIAATRGFVIASASAIAAIMTIVGLIIAFSRGGP